MKLTILPLLSLLIAAAPAPTTAPRQAAPAQPKPLAGNWAGDGFALRTVGTGYIVQGECASGKITAQVFPDASGSFAASGYYNAYRSGYRLSDVSPRDTPASFKGKINGNTLSMTMRIADRAEETRFVLKRGAKIKFPACN
jgi:hypothetical protein